MTMYLLLTGSIVIARCHCNVWSIHWLQKSWDLFWENPGQVGIWIITQPLFGGLETRAKKHYLQLARSLLVVMEVCNVLRFAKLSANAIVPTKGNRGESVASLFNDDPVLLLLP